MQHCLSCGKDTANPKFCSSSCAAKESNKTQRERKRYTFVACVTIQSLVRENECITIRAYKSVNLHFLKEVYEIGRKAHQL